MTEARLPGFKANIGSHSGYLFYRIKEGMVLYNDVHDTLIDGYLTSDISSATLSVSSKLCFLGRK